MPPPPRSPAEQVYLRTHARRYERLLELVRELGPRTILVVGPSFETELLREALPSARVDTLGWHDHRFPLREGEHHTQFDLNDDDYPDLAPHDAIVCGEVIEHLRVPPVPVLRFLAGGLEPVGRLILQTPNATALPKRLRMLLGRNPQDPIRDDPFNPGHFHEFTVAELLAAVSEAGLDVERWFTENYFDHGSRKNRAFRAAGPALPRTLREGITVVARPAN
ncbi:MAG TPA: methyltransferase domain-containing protein [Gaiellaceae bacterium]